MRIVNMFCNNCGTAIDEDTVFCTQCGKKIAEDMPLLFCPYCGSKYDQDAQFCAKCGSAKKSIKEIKEQKFHSKKKRKILRNIVIFFFVGIFIGFISYILYWNL